MEAVISNTEQMCYFVTKSIIFSYNIYGKKCFLDVKGVFFLHWYPPKNLKYGKPR